MTTCGGQYLLQDRLSLADVVVWATFYVLLSPEAPTAQSEGGGGWRGRVMGEREREREGRGRK